MARLRFLLLNSPLVLVGVKFLRSHLLVKWLRIRLDLELDNLRLALWWRLLIGSIKILERLLSFLMMRLGGEKLISRNRSPLQPTSMIIMHRPVKTLMNGPILKLLRKLASWKRNRIIMSHCNLARHRQPGRTSTKLRKLLKSLSSTLLRLVQIVRFESFSFVLLVLQFLHVLVLFSHDSVGLVYGLVVLQKG